MDYILINPVKHRYVQQEVDWPHSTIHRLIERGVVDANCWLTFAMARLERFDVGLDETQPNLPATSQAPMRPAWITGLNAANLEVYG